MRGLQRKGNELWDNEMKMLTQTSGSIRKGGVTQIQELKNDRGLVRLNEVGE